MKVKEAIQRLAGLNLEAELLLENTEKVIFFTKDVGSPWEETKNIYIVTTKGKEKPKTQVSKWKWVYWDNFLGSGFYAMTANHYSEKEAEAYIKERGGCNPERIHSSLIKEEEN